MPFRNLWNKKWTEAGIQRIKRHHTQTHQGARLQLLKPWCWATPEAETKVSYLGYGGREQNYCCLQMMVILLTPTPTLFSDVQSQCSCLQNLMLPWADKLYEDADIILQQDLAPAHTAKITKSWLNDHDKSPSSPINASMGTPPTPSRNSSPLRPPHAPSRSPEPSSAPWVIWPFSVQLWGCGTPSLTIWGPHWFFKAGPKNFFFLLKLFADCLLGLPFN